MTSALHTSLPPELARWVTHQAELMGLPSPDDVILLLITLAKQHNDLSGIAERYAAVFHGVAAPALAS
jgi:hypothetical protein